VNRDPDPAPPARLLETLGPLLGLRGAKALSGALADGRRARVSFVLSPSGRGRVLHARVAVAALDAPRLTVTLETWRSRLGKLLGRTREIEVGDEAFDRRFLLETPEPERVARALGRRELRDATEAAFTRYRVETLELDRGEMVATVRADALTPERYRELILLLSAAARTLDRVPVRVRVVGQEGREDAFGLCGQHAAVRCSYCHGDVTGEEPDLAVCRLCHTVIHDGCFQELGRCPLLGCLGKPPRRTKRRAPGAPAPTVGPADFAAAWDVLWSRASQGAEARAALARFAAASPIPLQGYLVAADEGRRRAAMDLLMLWREIPVLAVLACDAATPLAVRQDALAHLAANVPDLPVSGGVPVEPAAFKEWSGKRVRKLVRQARAEANLAAVPWIAALLQVQDPSVRGLARDTFFELTGSTALPLDVTALGEHWRPRARRRREVGPT
jgi:hypothetical protein